MLVLPAGVEGRQPQGAEATSSGTGAYNLFRPKPRELMRDMATDRPDQTESPYTVDAGHFQVEMDFIQATFDRAPGAGGAPRLVAWSVAPFNLKLGLLDRVDLQFVIDTYAGVRVEDPTAARTGEASGLGNVATRLKVNFWGNDGGRTAFGMMAFVRWPLPASGLRNGRTEGGLIFPLAVSVAGGWNVGAMTELDFLARPAGGYDAHLVNSVTVGHSLTRRLGMYVELLAASGFQRGSGWLAQLDVGWTYALRDTVQVDCGSNFGLTASAPTARPFAGLSLRF
jgi:hypothetical protein